MAAQRHSVRMGHLRLRPLMEASQPGWLWQRPSRRSSRPQWPPWRLEPRKRPHQHQHQHQHQVISRGEQSRRRWLATPLQLALCLPPFFRHTHSHSLGCWHTHTPPSHCHVQPLQQLLARRQSAHRQKQKQEERSRRKLGTGRQLRPAERPRPASGAQHRGSAAG